MAKRTALKEDENFVTLCFHFHFAFLHFGKLTLKKIPRYMAHCRLAGSVLVGGGEHFLRHSDSDSTIKVNYFKARIILTSPLFSHLSTSKT